MLPRSARKVKKAAQPSASLSGAAGSAVERRGDALQQPVTISDSDSSAVICLPSKRAREEDTESPVWETYTPPFSPIPGLLENLSPSADLPSGEGDVPAPSHLESHDVSCDSDIFGPDEPLR